MEILPAVDTRYISCNHPCLHLQAGHQGIRRALLEAQQVPHILHLHRTVFRQVVQHALLIWRRLILLAGTAPVHKLAVDLEGREGRLAPEQEFAVGDVAALHAGDLPVPGPEGILFPVEPVFTRCEFLDGISGNDILEKRDKAGFLHGLHHRLGAVYTKRPATRAAAGHKVFLLADGHFRTDS